jgi:hypothetical protein
MLREARRIQNKALIANFVDRELERPALGPRDFLPLPMIGSTSEPENENPCSKPKGRLRYNVQTLFSIFFLNNNNNTAYAVLILTRCNPLCTEVRQHPTRRRMQLLGKFVRLSSSLLQLHSLYYFGG